MSAMQSGSRRLSARLQGKEDAQTKIDSLHDGGLAPKGTARSQAMAQTQSKKRRNEYDEDDAGFTFSRVSKNKKRRQSKDEATAQVIAGAGKSGPAVSDQHIQDQTTANKATLPAPALHKDDDETMELPKKRRKKMSFSTPKKESQPVRRSKRLSSEVPQPEDTHPPAVVATDVKSRKKARPTATESKIERPIGQKADDETYDQASHSQEDVRTSESVHEATKIALPFADTPVIRRNKAMREGKSMKGDRRSSLGLRGRRASSLIETGNSNALPHQEVDAVEFYKHIESDLMEPRRMRQLLTWCATRAMHAKPKGTNFEDASAKSAARIIEEELLKELSNKSELSDWFNREDIDEPPKPLLEKPNPKNVQNRQKIAELETQINRLKVERAALQSLLHPPDVPEIGNSNTGSNTNTEIDRTLLSNEDAALLDALHDSSRLSKTIAQRINEIGSSIEPSIDSFADNVHRVAQYRTATDNVAGRVLSICAEKLSNREKAGRRKALHTEEDRSPGRDLGNVLRGLSKTDR